MLLKSNDYSNLRSMLQYNTCTLPKAKAWHPIHAVCQIGRFCLSIGVFLLISAQNTRCQADGTLPVQAPPTSANKLLLLHRSITQDQGAWVIDYEFSYKNLTGIVLTSKDISACIEGWVSNSRVASHAVPRLVRVSLDGRTANSATGDVIISNDELQQCRVCLAIWVWSDDTHPPDDGGIVPISLAPGVKVHARIRLSHQHVLYGNYDPLLGIQTIKMGLGSEILCDEVPLDCEHYLAQPRYTWPNPPTDRQDTRHFISPPDSLHLEAHVPGHQSYRYPDSPVRYGAKVRLRFWYLTAKGTEGECRVQLDQYKDTPKSWHPLTSSRFEQALNTVGHWTKFEQTIRTDIEATTVALGFRIISETNVGELWIDNISLEPIGQSRTSSDP